MTGQTKALLIGVILIGGLLLSLPFRHSAEKRSALDSPTQDEVWLKKTSWKSDAADEQEPVIEPKVIVPETTSPMEELDPIQTPPSHRPIASLQHTLTQIPDNVVAVKKPFNETATEPVNIVPQPIPTTALNVPRKLATPNTRVITHVVRDGDTLQSLAKRYLGDARRAMEIFNANRSKLKNPNMLPVNDELIIEIQR